jgi:hypothetical protein
MELIRGRPGLYVAREPDNRLPFWDLTTARREPLERVDRSWRGVVMDTYALEKLTGWTPELSPPPDTPMFRWRVLADNARLRSVAAVADDRDKRRDAMIVPFAGGGTRVLARSTDGTDAASVGGVHYFFDVDFIAVVPTSGAGRDLPLSASLPGPI